MHKLIIFDNIDHCKAYLDWLNDEMEVDFTNTIEHPTKKLFAIVLEFENDYNDKLLSLFVKVQLEDWNEEWINKLDY